MKVVVSKWGNSYAVRLPKELIEELELSERSVLKVERSEDGFQAKKETEQEELERMLEDMNPRKELDWGDPRGREVW